MPFLDILYNKKIKLIVNLKIKKMQQTITITDILAEDFETPDFNPDLESLIHESKEVYEDMLPCGRQRKLWRVQLNELIETYNDRLGMEIFTLIK